MSNTKRGFLREQSRRGQEGQSPIITTLMVMTFTLIGVSFWLIFIGMQDDKAITEGLSSSYGAKLVSVSKPLFDKNTMVIERDGKQYRCDYPSAKMVESKAPLSCGEALTSISPK